MKSAPLQRHPRRTSAALGALLVASVALGAGCARYPVKTFAELGAAPEEGRLASLRKAVKRAGLEGADAAGEHHPGRSQVAHDLHRPAGCRHQGRPAHPVAGLHRLAGAPRPRCNPRATVSCSIH